MKADNPTNNVHENEPRSEYGNLPAELKAMQTMMDAVFGAVIAAPQVRPAVVGEALDQPCEPGPAGAAPRRMDIETEIMRAPGFDYLLASEIFAALQRRLELRYENLNPQVEEAMQKLSRAFEQAS